MARIEGVLPGIQQAQICTLYTVPGPDIPFPARDHQKEKVTVASGIPLNGL